MSKALDNKTKLNSIVSVTDYGAKGDGVTNDGAAIVAALATGKNIVVPQGTYLINGYTLTPVSGQRIYGGGTLKKTAISAGGEQFIKIENVNNVTIDGVNFLDTRSSGARSYGITTQNSSNVVIRNNEFQGYETPVFIWRLSDKISVLNNIMTGVGGSFGIATGGDASGNTNGAVTNITISGNVIANKTDEGIDINWDTQGIVVNGNTLLNNNTVSAEEDIDIGGGVCRDIIISDNLIDSGGRSKWGITVKLDTDRVQINGNVIRGFTEHGIGNPSSAAGVNDLSIVGNQIHGGGTATQSGIYARTWVGVNITGNTITGCLNDGITLSADVTGALVTGNRCVNNVDGIVCLSPQTVISGNYCGDGSGNGINVQARSCAVTGNVLVNNNTYGIVLTAGSDYSTVIGNVISDLRGGSVNQDGIFATGASDRVIIANNICYPVQATAVSGVSALTNSTVVESTLQLKNSATIANDSVITITPPNASGFIEVWAEATTTAYGKRYYRVGASPAMANVFSGAAFASTTGTLTGTTGTVGNLTISALTDGTIQIENRTSVSRVVGWQITTR